jgi:hypothetical protein
MVFDRSAWKMRRPARLARPRWGPVLDLGRPARARRLRRPLLRRRERLRALVGTEGGLAPGGIVSGANRTHVATLRRVLWRRQKPLHPPTRLTAAAVHRLIHRAGGLATPQCNNAQSHQGRTGGDVHLCGGRPVCPATELAHFANRAGGAVGPARRNRYRRLRTGPAIPAT